MGILDGRVILVSGGGRGLGRAFAEAVAAERAEVIVADIDQTLGEETAAAINDAGGIATFEWVDIGAPQTVEALAARVKDRHGHLDGLLNNAGLATGIGGKTFEEI
ncbi:MAG: SDR family NAD(P)-dependent oxidoreductase, partial [Proteobacteria bacterium]|nr:SDR family NAD(P)-dependent oxidoreductase [Pseudomonadota bacterium]